MKGCGEESNGVHVRMIVPKSHTVLCYAIDFLHFKISISATDGVLHVSSLLYLCGYELTLFRASFYDKSLSISYQYPCRGNLFTDFSSLH